MAIELGADIVNNGNAELAKILPLAEGGGLPGLKGAKIQLVFADNQGTPAAGQNQALRLITEEKVVALIGAYQSGITRDGQRDRRALRHPVPDRRVGRRQPHRARLQVVLPRHAGRPRLRRAPTRPSSRSRRRPARRSTRSRIVHENTEYGNSVASVIAEAVRQGRLHVTQKISYSANSTDVQPQVLQLKEKNPDVVIFISYTSDAILYTKTMKELNWKPAILIADDAGFNDPAFVKSMALEVEGLINRTAFAAGKPGSVPSIFNALYKKKTGGDDLDDASARGLQGFLVLVDAINRAGSTDPAKIQAALKATDLKPTRW